MLTVIFLKDQQAALHKVLKIISCVTMNLFNQMKKFVIPIMVESLFLMNRHTDSDSCPACK